MGRIENWAQSEIGWVAEASEMRVAQTENYAVVLVCTTMAITNQQSVSFGGGTAIFSQLKGVMFDCADRHNTLQGAYVPSINGATGSKLDFDGGATSFNTARFLIWGSAF